MPPPETASLTQFPYIALNLAALRMKICSCHLCRAFGSGFAGGEIASTWTVGMAGLGGSKMLPNRKAYGSFVSWHSGHVSLILLQS